MEGLEQQNFNFLRPIDKEVPILIPLNKKIRDTKPLLSYINSIIKNNNEKVFVYSSYEIPNIPKGVTFIKEELNLPTKFFLCCKMLISNRKFKKNS